MLMADIFCDANIYFPNDHFASLLGFNNEDEIKSGGYF